MKTYDLVGVGIGPFNLGLAALAHPVEDIDALFLDASPEFAWHPGLLLDWATLQVPFLADLVTLADPTSEFSFLNYLREHDRLFPFYFAERFLVPRREYDHYCRWVAAALPSCRFGARVERLAWDGDAFTVTIATGDTGASTGTETVRARNVVLGVGTEPVVPPAFAELLGRHVFHAGEYLGHADELAGAADVTVVGSGQSGAEVFLDLLRRGHPAGQRVRWITRTRAFAPMEYSKIGLEHFTPDYTRYFHGLPEQVRDGLVPSQWQLYKGASAQTLGDIHNALYELTVGGGAVDAQLMPAVAVERAGQLGSGYRLTCRHTEQGGEFTFDTDRVVLATGYAAVEPEFLAPLRPCLGRDAQGRLRIGTDYRIALDAQIGGSIFVQNAELHTHGVGAPDLGLGAWRSATILNELTGRTVYRLPQRTAFTTFGTPS